MKITVEWVIETTKGPTWGRVETRLRESRRGNGFFRLKDRTYVVPDWKLGGEVLGKTAEGWEPIGRVARGPGGNIVFIGPGLSYAEYSRLVFLRDLLGGKHPDLAEFLNGEERRRREEELAELEKTAVEEPEEALIHAEKEEVEG